MSVFANVELAPGDPILGVTDAFNADARPFKANLGVGIYCDDEGRIPVLPSVATVEQFLLGQQRTRSYIAIDGMAGYNAATQKLVFGADSPLLEAGRVVTAQTLGGSGALRVGADLLKKFLPAGSRVALSSPSWENHRALLDAARFEVVDYRYYHAATHGLDFDGMMQDLSKLEPGDVVLLHACCHNPTGVDLNHAQWKQVVELVKERKLVPFLDMAYQGFDQNADDDAYAIRLFGESGIEVMVVASSYSKSFSLYGERVGALSVVCANADEAARVKSQVRRIIRANYSSPPTHGATLVSGVLNSDELRAQWLAEVGQMRERIHAMRDGFVHKLAALGAEEFSFVRQQAGMFSYSGLNPVQVKRLAEEYAVYVVGTGRICVAALRSGNIEHVVKAVYEVSRG